MKVLVLLVALAAVVAAAPSYDTEEAPSVILVEEGNVVQQAAEYAASIATHARNDQPSADEPEVKPHQSEPEEHKEVEPDVKQAVVRPNPLDVVNTLLTALNLPNITVTNPSVANITAVAQGLLLVSEQIASNIVNQNYQATLNSLALFTNVTTSLLNLPSSILRFPNLNQPQQASSDEAHQPGFKKIPDGDSPSEQEQEKVQKPDKPVFFLPRRPEFYYPQPYPYYGPYQQPYQPFYHLPAVPYQYPGRYGPPSQFRRPAASNPTADESLSDLEALAQLEELLAKSDEESYYREAEARGLLSSLYTGANSVRAGFKNMYNSISAALPSIVYKTLVVPSLASGSSSSNP